MAEIVQLVPRLTAQEAAAFSNERGPEERTEERPNKGRKAERAEERVPDARKGFPDTLRPIASTLGQIAMLPVLAVGWVAFFAWLAIEGMIHGRRK